MNGFFNVKLFDTGGMTDDEVFSKIKDNGLGYFCNNISLKKQCLGSNRLFDGFAAKILEKVFLLGAIPSAERPLWYDSDWWGFLCINLNNDDTETNSYTELVNSCVGLPNTDSNVSGVDGSVDTTSGSKLFIQSSMAYEIKSDPESDKIIFSSKFLYLPSEAISSEIRSLVVCSYMTDSWGGNCYAALRTARIRLKDDDGKLVTISKTKRDVLIVEYIFNFVSG